MTHRRSRHGKCKRIPAGNNDRMVSDRRDDPGRDDLVDQCKKCWKRARCPDPERARGIKCKDYEEL